MPVFPLHPRFLLAAALVAAPILSHPVMAQSVFLGDLQAFDSTDDGLVLTCAPGAQLAVRFVTASVLRVTLTREGVDEVPLAEVLARTEWPGAPVRFEETADALTLRSDALELVVHRTPCRLTVRDAEGTVLVADDEGLGVGWDGPEVRNWKALAEGERFFGLGEKTGDLDKRGREWTMWNSDIPGYTNDTDPLYQSIPFFLGVRGAATYGLYFNNPHRSTFNLGAGNHRYYSFAAERGPLDYFVFAGTVPEIVESYTALTGRMPLPPRWALGYQQSRWSYYPASEVLRIARTFREKHIPADVLYLDIHYMDGYRVFTWDEDRFPDPEGLLRELEGLGFKTIVIVDPGVKEDPDYAVAQEGRAGDHFVRYPDGEVYVGSVWPGRSYFPDFSRAATRAWWADRLAALRAQGVDGIWNDMNEPAVWGKAFPTEVVAEGGDFKRMRNLYGFYMGQAAYEGLRERRPDERPFVLTRAGFAGGQRHTAVWTGDNVASWEHLALGLRMMLGLGLSGVAFNGMDIGGFMGTPSPELYARWVEASTFAPLMRSHTHHGSPAQEPWSFGEHVEAISRRTIELRYRMLPMLYTLIHEAHRTGAPVMRPLFWHYPDDPTAWHRDWQHQFLVGEHLLAAPVTREGATMQRVYLPAGRWLDWHTGAAYDGGQTVVVDAPLDRLPLFLSATGIVPTQPVVQHTGETPGGPLTLDVFPAADAGHGELYEDDGASFAYEDGAYRLTVFAYTRDGDGVTFTRRVTHDGYAVPARMLEVRFHAADAPESVEAEGRALRVTPGGGEGFAYDPERRLLTVRVRESGGAQRLTIR